MSTNILAVLLSLVSICALAGSSIGYDCQRSSDSTPIEKSNKKIFLIFLIVLTLVSMSVAAGFLFMQMDQKQV
jgi:hypothetical protein